MPVHIAQGAEPVEKGYPSQVFHSTARLPLPISFSLDDDSVNSLPHTPGYIYVIAIVLSLPATWFVLGTAGEHVPGMIAMIVTMVFMGIFTLALSSLRHRLQNRRSEDEASSDDHF